MNDCQPTSALTRFLRHVGPVNENGCQLWTGSLHEDGYGRFCGGKRPSGRQRVLLAHRAAWLLQLGDIPTGLCVLHRCDVRRCVNPEHLFLGTNAENVADRVAKGRSRKTNPRGEDHAMRKLSESDVRAIRKRYAAESLTMKSLAAEYGVGRQNVSVVLSRKTWRHLA